MKPRKLQTLSTPRSPVEGGLTPYGLLAPDKVIERTRYRSEHRENVQVELAADLGIHSEERGRAFGFYASVPVRGADGSAKMKNLPLSHAAIRTACRLLPGNVTPAFFAGADDPEAFPKLFQNIMDSQKRRRHGMLVRHDGFTINAILSPDYIIKDAADLLEEFIPALRDNVGEIVGILGIEQGDGEIASYRIVMGNNIMAGIEDSRGQYIMMNINTSETGLIDTKTSLGLFRTFCNSSAIRTQTLSRWDHKTAFAEFFERSATVLRQSGYLKEAYRKVFKELSASPLPLPARDIIDSCRREMFITCIHAEAALVHAEASPAKTQYDLFNIMARSAQDLPTIVARERAEMAAMSLFTEPGGTFHARRRQGF